MCIHMHRRGEDIDVSSADSNGGNLETYKDRRKCNKQKIQCCFVEYQIYFMSKAEFCDLFTHAVHSWKYHRILPYLWNKFDIQQNKIEYPLFALAFQFRFCQVNNDILKVKINLQWPYLLENNPSLYLYICWIGGLVYSVVITGVFLKRFEYFLQNYKSYPPLC